MHNELKQIREEISRLASDAQTDDDFPLPKDLEDMLQAGRQLIALAGGLNEVISDEEINKAWGNANFGNTPRREIIADALEKIAQGYTPGFTARSIVLELGLTKVRRGGVYLSEKGLKYLLNHRMPVIGGEDAETPEELGKEAQRLIVTLLPPGEYGEDERCERLYNIVSQLAGIPNDAPEF